MAIHRHSRTPDGTYAVISDVNQIPAQLEEEEYDGQLAHFMSGTLKFLYLTFTEDDVLPLDRWIFTEVGHPLPILDSGNP